MKKRIAVIFGGEGCEHDVSCTSAAEVIKNLDSSLFLPVPVGISGGGDWYIYGGDPANIGSARWAGDGAVLTSAFPVRRGGISGLLTPRGIMKVDAALPVLHGDLGEDGTVQGALRCAGIPTVGSGVLGGALCCDKITVKRVADAMGIPTLPWFSVTDGQCRRDTLLRAADGIGYPLIVKPSGLGSSVGIATATDAAALLAALTAARRADRLGRVLIEKYLEGARELECAVLEDGEVRRILPPGEVICRGVYTYSEKYGADSRAGTVLHSDLAPEIARRIRDMTGALFSALAIRDLCRADYLLSPDGDIYLNEINTFPGMTEKSLYPGMCRESGISFTAMLTILINSALRRGNA